MIKLDNCSFFLDKRTSKNGKEYTALFLEVEEKEILVCFVNSSLYDYLKNLSK